MSSKKQRKSPSVKLNDLGPKQDAKGGCDAKGKEPAMQTSTTLSAGWDLLANKKPV